MVGVVTKSLVLSLFFFLICDLVSSAGTKSVYPHNSSLSHLKPVDSDCRLIGAVLIIRHGIKYPNLSQSRSFATFTRDSCLASYLRSHPHFDWIGNWTSPFPMNRSNLLAPPGEQELIQIAKRVRHHLESKAQHTLDVKIAHSSTNRTLHAAQVIASVFGVKSLDLDDQSARFFENSSSVKTGKHYTEQTLKPAKTALLARVRQKIIEALELPQNCLSDEEVETMHKLCVFETAHFSNSSWCSIFALGGSDSLESFNAMEDYENFQVFGPSAATLAMPLFKSLFSTFTRMTQNSSTTIPRLHVIVGHAETIMPIAALLDRPRGSYHFHSAEHRSWRSSDIAPFAGNILLQLNQCSQVHELSVFMNEKFLPLWCSEATSNACRLDEFFNGVIPFQLEEFSWWIYPISFLLLFLLALRTTGFPRTSAIQLSKASLLLLMIFAHILQLVYWTAVVESWSSYLWWPRHGIIRSLEVLTHRSPFNTKDAYGWFEGAILFLVAVGNLVGLIKMLSERLGHSKRVSALLIGLCVMIFFVYPRSLLPRLPTHDKAFSCASFGTITFWALLFLKKVRIRFRTISAYLNMKGLKFIIKVLAFAQAISKKSPEFLHLALVSVYLFMADQKPKESASKEELPLLCADLDQDALLAEQIKIAWSLNDSSDVESLELHLALIDSRLNNEKKSEFDSTIHQFCQGKCYDRLVVQLLAIARHQALKATLSACHSRIIPSETQHWKRTNELINQSAGLLYRLHDLFNEIRASKLRIKRILNPNHSALLVQISCQLVCAALIAERVKKDNNLRYHAIMARDGADGESLELAQLIHDQNAVPYPRVIVSHSLMAITPATPNFKLIVTQTCNAIAAVEKFNSSRLNGTWVFLGFLYLYIVFIYIDYWLNGLLGLMLSRYLKALLRS